MFILAEHIFGSNEFVGIPARLGLRQENLSHLIIPLLIFSFFLLSFSKFYNSSIFKSLLKLLVSSKNFDQIMREELRIGSLSSITMIVNYFCITTCCVFLSIHNDFDWSKFQLVSFSLLVPIVIVGFQLMNYWVIGWVSKEVKVALRPIHETFVALELMGLVFFFLALVWILNPQFDQVFYHLFIWISIIGFTYRSLKSISVVFLRGVSWYYIILYLCTLEILPVLLVGLYIHRNIGV